MSTNLSITSPSWWKAAFFRALRTALVVAVPFFGATQFTDIPLLAAVSTTGFAFVASFLTSLAGIPEANGSATPFWVAIITRIGKTFAQSLVAGFGTAVLFESVDWPLVLQGAGIAAAGSLFIALLNKLPEVPVIDPSGSQPTVLVKPTAANEAGVATAAISPRAEAPKG